MRGTIYAIYQFSQVVLGVDPMYLWTDREPEKVAGDPAAFMIRRVFYEVEELTEVHLNLLEGVGERFSSPHFDNLMGVELIPKVGHWNQQEAPEATTRLMLDWLARLPQSPR